MARRERYGLSKSYWPLGDAASYDCWILRVDRLLDAVYRFHILIMKVAKSSDPLYWLKG